MKTVLVLVLLSAVVAAGCAQTGRTGTPATVDSRSSEQAACEGRGGGFWVAAPGMCTRGGGGAGGM